MGSLRLHFKIICMILSFKTKFEDQTQTQFVRRIWDGLLLNGLATQEQFQEYSQKWNWWWWSIPVEEDWEKEVYAKIHTIRHDPHDRWKVGMSIHFTINNRRPDRLQFAPVIPCVSVQKIRIEKELINSNPTDKSWNIKKFHFWIDGQPYGNHSSRYGYDEDIVEYISQHDGFMFDSQFMNWWPEGTFEGKIIHWTNFRYNADPGSF